MILYRDVERLVRCRKGPGSSFLPRRQWAGGVGCTVTKPTDQKMKPKKESIASNALTEPLTMPGGRMCLFVHCRGFDYPYTHDRASPSLLQGAQHRLPRGSLAPFPRTSRGDGKARKPACWFLSLSAVLAHTRPNKKRDWLKRNSRKKCGLQFPVQSLSLMTRLG